MPGNRVFRREKPVQKQGDLSGMPVSVGYISLRSGPYPDFFLLLSRYNPDYSMKKLLLAFAAGVCLSACATHDPKISIVPYPNHLEPGHGTFAVKGEGVVCDSRADERTQRAVAEFAAQLAKTSGGENPVTVADELPASGIRFVLDQTLPEEGHFCGKSRTLCHCKGISSFS